jgi:hypothetical protein
MTERTIVQFITKDSQGREHTILYSREWKETTPALDGTTELIEVRDGYQTSDGQAVNRLEKGKYQIVPTGVIVMCDPAVAPLDRAAREAGAALLTRGRPGQA